MCAPGALESMACPDISRRSLLKFGLGAAAAALALVGAPKIASGSGGPSRVMAVW